MKLDKASPIGVFDSGVGGLSILKALQAQMPHEQVVYEDLVADPAGHASRCLERLGLQMEPGVLSPERNARAVFTLSHAQVKQPINRGSIGRWKNYEFAFDDSWRALAEAHDARRMR